MNHGLQGWSPCIKRKITGLDRVAVTTFFSGRSRLEHHNVVDAMVIQDSMASSGTRFHRVYKGGLTWIDCLIVSG